MEEAKIEVFKDKLIRGVVALTTRTFILQMISFISTFILTILLSPAAFGIFFIVTAVISLLSYFSDFGLAAALIQKKDEPERRELVSVFTIQQVLVGGICLCLLIFSSSIGNYYKLDQDGVFLLRALTVSFFLSSLKTIPSVLLERKLQFDLLVVPQILETFIFYLVAIVFASKGLGVLSFAWASLARGVVGLIAIYLVSPWRIGLGLSFGSIKHLLNFGLPFQMNSFLAFIKDDLMTLFLGKILPLNQIGYLGWAKKWAEAPLRLIMDNIIRVTFPAFARLQNEKIILGKAIEKSFFFLGLFTLPISALLVIFIHPMVDIIPKYSKWEPAVLAFYLYTLSSVFAAFSSPMVNALNAIGKIKSTLLMMVAWTILTWVLVPVLSIKMGFNGAAIAAAIISSTSIIPILMVKKIVDFSAVKPLTKSAVSSLFMTVPVYLMINYNSSLAVVIFSFFAGIIIYAVLVRILMKEEIRPYLPKYFKFLL